MPPWLLLEDHGDGTATLRGTPTNADIGLHPVRLSAADATTSVEQSFTRDVVAGVPAAPAPQAPEDGALDLETRVELTWRAVAGASTYTLHVADREDFTVLRVDEQGVVDTTFVVDGLSSGTTYFWRVQAVNGVGESLFSATFRFATAVGVAVEEEGGIPSQFALHQNYPNPFNPSTRIAYELPQAADVRLVVYDLFGREVARLVDATQGAGRHEVVFEASSLASGPYFYRIEAGAWSRIRQLVLLK
jgi:hypothetical protein